MRKTTIALTFFVAWLLAMPTVWAQKDEAKEHAELAKAMKDTKVSLQKGLAASTREGKPISAKYEMEDGKGRAPVTGVIFTAIKPGPHPITCTKHTPDMWGALVVVPE